jgi:hypothetical protein
MGEASKDTDVAKSFSLVSSCVRIVKNVHVHVLYYFLAFLKADPNAAPVPVLQESFNRSVLL